MKLNYVGLVLLPTVFMSGLFFLVIGSGVEWGGFFAYSLPNWLGLYALCFIVYQTRSLPILQADMVLKLGELENTLTTWRSVIAQIDEGLRELQDMHQGEDEQGRLLFKGEREFELAQRTEQTLAELTAAIKALAGRNDL